jgi:hypothetical protein
MLDSDRAYSRQEFLEEHPLLLDPELLGRFPDLVDAARVCESSLRCSSCSLARVGIVNVNQYLEGLKLDVQEAIEHYESVVECIPGRAFERR